VFTWQGVKIGKEIKEKFLEGKSMLKGVLMGEWEDEVGGFKSRMFKD
jgi:hypothetical protein